MGQQNATWWHESIMYTCQIFVSVIYTQPIVSPFSHVCAHADVCTDSAAARHTRRQRSSGLAILHTTRTGRPAKRHSPVRRGLWPREEARTRRSGRSAEHTANVVTHATRRRHHIATAAATAPNARQNVTGCRSTSKVVCGLHWACAFLRPMRHGCAHRGGHSAADLGVGSPRRRSVRRGGGHLHRALCSDVLAVRWSSGGGGGDAVTAARGMIHNVHATLCRSHRSPRANFHTWPKPTANGTTPVERQPEPAEQGINSGEPAWRTRWCRLEAHRTRTNHKG